MLIYQLLADFEGPNLTKLNYFKGKADIQPKKFFNTNAIKPKNLIFQAKCADLSAQKLILKKFRSEPWFKKYFLSQRKKIKRI